MASYGHPIRIERVPIGVTKEVAESEVSRSKKFQAFLGSRLEDPAPRQPSRPPKLDAWDETRERRTHYLKRMRGSLEGYTREIHEKAPSRGLKPWPATRTGAGDSLVWVVRYQVMEQAYAKIAREQRAENKRVWLKSKKAGEDEPDTPDDETLSKKVKRLATDMGLTLRLP